MKSVELAQSKLKNTKEVIKLCGVRFLQTVSQAIEYFSHNVTMRTLCDDIHCALLCTVQETRLALAVYSGR